MHVNFNPRVDKLKNHLAALAARRHHPLSTGCIAVAFSSEHYELRIKVSVQNGHSSFYKTWKPFLSVTQDLTVV